MTGIVVDVEYQTSPVREFRGWRRDSCTIMAKERRRKGRERQNGA
jgi:hypothetical protein